MHFVGLGIVKSALHMLLLCGAHLSKTNPQVCVMEITYDNTCKNKPRVYSQRLLNIKRLKLPVHLGDT